MNQFSGLSKNTVYRDVEEDTVLVSKREHEDQGFSFNSVPHQPCSTPTWGAPSPSSSTCMSLTKTDFERIEMNRLAAIERRKQKAIARSSYYSVGRQHHAGSRYHDQYNPLPSPQHSDNVMPFAPNTCTHFCGQIENDRVTQGLGPGPVFQDRSNWNMNFAGISESMHLNASPTSVRKANTTGAHHLRLPVYQENMVPFHLGRFRQVRPSYVGLSNGPRCNLEHVSGKRHLLQSDSCSLPQNPINLSNIHSMSSENDANICKTAHTRNFQCITPGPLNIDARYPSHYVQRFRRDAKVMQECRGNCSPSDGTRHRKFVSLNNNYIKASKYSCDGKTHISKTRKLKQATLGDTMQRYRASKVNIGIQDNSSSAKDICFQEERDMRNSEEFNSAMFDQEPLVSDGGNDLASSNNPNAEYQKKIGQGRAKEGTFLSQEKNVHLFPEVDDNGDIKLVSDNLILEYGEGSDIMDSSNRDNESDAELRVSSSHKQEYNQVPVLQDIKERPSIIKDNALIPYNCRLNKGKLANNANDNERKKEAIKTHKAIIDGLKQGRWTWLVDRRDKNGNRPDHPLYDPRTLFIPTEDFAKLRGFNKQYWAIKKNAMDLVLFVRVGSFYELYDTDADIGLSVGLKPMGSIKDANMWKVGCNAGSLMQWISRILMRGYSVGRVEECHFLVREKQKGEDKLIPRKLVQIYSPGTVLECEVKGMTSIDDCKFENKLLSIPTNTGSFMALWEVSKGLFGACTIDLTTSEINLVQWQEIDSNRVNLQTLLYHVNPGEVVLSSSCSLSLDSKKALKGFKPLICDGVESQSLCINYLRHSLSESIISEARETPKSFLKKVEGIFCGLGGNKSSFMDSLNMMEKLPDSIPALVVALMHLYETRTCDLLLPKAFISHLTIFTAEGAKRTGKMFLDGAAIRSMEILEGSLGTIHGSLLYFLTCKAATSAAKRCIRRWICSPLYRIKDINERLDAVALFMQCPELTSQFQDTLRELPDCERLLPKVASLFSEITAIKSGENSKHELLGDCDVTAAWKDDGFDFDSASRPDFSNGKNSMQRIVDLSPSRFVPVSKLLDSIASMVKGVNKLVSALNLYKSGASSIPCLSEAMNAGDTIISMVLKIQPMFSTQITGSSSSLGIVPDVHPSYDEAENELNQIKDALQNFLQDVRDILRSQNNRVNLKTLHKVKISEVLIGEDPILLEVPSSLTSNFQDQSFVLVQRSGAVYKYRVDCLSDIWEKLQRAQKKADMAVLEFISSSARLFIKQYQDFLRFFTAATEIDSLIALAKATNPASAPPGCAFTRPEFREIDSSMTSIVESPILKLRSVWNPQLLMADPHILPNQLNLSKGIIKSNYNTIIQTNDVDLNQKDGLTMILTGANAAGKSTLLRSVCLSTIMAHVGCYVPALKAEFSPVDRICTRLGSHDRIAAGESTFFVEMAETSTILRHAGRSSLILLDELGRGTSSYDGLAIAGAVSSWLTREVKPRVIFATHHHELNTDKELLSLGVQLAHMETAISDCIFGTTSSCNVEMDSVLGASIQPSYRLLPGPAKNGSCGIEVASRSGLPLELLRKAKLMSAQYSKINKKALEKNLPRKHDYDISEEEKCARTIFQGLTSLISTTVSSLKHEKPQLLLKKMQQEIKSNLLKEE